MALDRLCRAAQGGVRARGECTPALAPDLLFATVAGSTAGVIVWWLAKLWPSLSWFSLMVALTTFWFALRIFNGPRGTFRQEASQARVHVPWDELRGKTWRLNDVLSGEIHD
jgi:hypothetical protein